MPVGECLNPRERVIEKEGPSDPLGYEALGVEVEPESEELEVVLAGLELESELFDESEPVAGVVELGDVDGVDDPDDPLASFL